MTSTEISALITEVNSDILALARARAVQSEVRQAIRYRADNPLEEQLIDEDTTGVVRGEPRVETVDGVRLSIWKIHRAGLNSTDIKGADLYYETAQGKFVLIQYKTPSSRTGRIKKDQEQLEELRAACPQRCAPRRRFSCGAWVAIRDATAGMFLPACEVSDIFGTRASRSKSAFISGSAKDQFQSDFASCLIGGRTRLMALSNTVASLVAADHILFEVIEG